MSSKCPRSSEASPPERTEAGFFHYGSEGRGYAFRIVIRLGQGLRVLHQDRVIVAFRQSLEPGIGFLAAQGCRKQRTGRDLHVSLGLCRRPLHQHQESDVARSKNRDAHPDLRLDSQPLHHTPHLIASVLAFS